MVGGLVMEEGGEDLRYPPVGMGDREEKLPLDNGGVLI